MRIGQGYDIHELTPGRDFILGGVKIPNKTGLLGHSDADVLCHAVIDSIFGAAALGDIGGHFPDTSPEYKNANSLKLLEKAGEILKNAGYKILNIDTTVVCQSPRLAPYKTAMQENIALALKIPAGCVSVKAKTKEGLDAVGNSRAVEVWAIVLAEEIAGVET